MLPHLTPSQRFQAAIVKKREMKDEEVAGGISDTEVME